MRQIHFLTEAELKRRLDRETFTILFETSEPTEAALKEFFAQLKTWAEEQNAKYCIAFSESWFERFELLETEESPARSITNLSKIVDPPFAGVPSKFFPAFVWGESLYFPFASEESTLSSKIAMMEEKIEVEAKQKTKSTRNASIYRLEFQILAGDSFGLEQILDLDIPASLVEKIIERDGEFFLLTPKLNGTRALFAIYLLSAIFEKIEFNFSKVTIDLSSDRAVLPIWFKRSGAALAGIDAENSPGFQSGNFPSLEIAASPWLSASFLFLILNSSFLDAWENAGTNESVMGGAASETSGGGFETRLPKDLQTETITSFPRSGRNESWRDLTEHRFASRVSRHAGEEENFYYTLLQKEYETSKNILDSTLESRKEELEEFEIPELLDRLKAVQDSSQTISFHEAAREDWKTIQSEIMNSVLERWKERKEVTTKKIEEISSASAWKNLIEIWKS
ncbi:hypothetical protein DLM76_11745 [Leptospira yasudae]|uniref:hypothetical protein n=1 Tax=Leptospira yasudae TaxID=2202201 RepID=UPI000E5A0AD1|nr:hypothetical protein [Leptospira yasudae]RHX93683.1 hypothetical protein DLM76_11745 [Leptospira yasudae]